MTIQDEFRLLLKRGLSQAEVLSVLGEQEAFQFEAEINEARDMYADDDCEIDDKPLVSPALDGSGVWVSAWVWVLRRSP